MADLYSDVYSDQYGTASATVVASWTGTFSNTHNQATPPPGTQSCQVSVANTGATGRWMFCLVAWRQPAGYVTTVAVGDDAHNFWEPLGNPAAATPASGGVRCAIWYTRNPAAATKVLVAPTAYCPAIAAEVVEVSGMSPWATLAGISGQAGVTGASVPAPGVLALMFTLLAYDNHLTSAVPTAGNGWTNLATVVSSNFTDEVNDCELNAAWQVTSGAAVGAWTPSGPTPGNYAVLTAGVLVTGNTPTAASQTWPMVQAQAAFGAGALTPWDQIIWTDLTPRFQALAPARGKQYELDSIQSGTGTWKLSNNDGALTPDYQGSPYWLGVAGWQVTAGNGTLVPSSQYTWQGQPAAVFTPDGMTPNGRFSSTQQPVSAAAGDHYCQAAVLCPAGWPSVKLFASWFDGSGAFISSTTAQTAAAPAGEWLLLSGTVTPAPGSVTGTVVVEPVGTPYPSTRFWVAAAFLMSPTGAVVNTNPFFQVGAKSYTPVRLLVTWPPPPDPNARTYVVHRAFMERWPLSLTGARYQIANAVSVDAWTLTTGQLLTLPRSEILADAPDAWWPLDDPQGAASGSQKAPTPYGAIQVIASKNGTGGATQAFGNSASFLAGDSSPGCWTVSGVTAIDQGYSLYFQDDSLPPIGNPLTVEVWFSMPAGQPSGQKNILTIGTGAGAALQVYADPSSGSLNASVIGDFAEYEISTATVLNGNWYHLVVTYDPTHSTIGWQFYLNGTLRNTVGTLGTTGARWWLSVAGRATPTAVANMCNASVAGLAVYPIALDAARVETRYLAYTTGMYGGDTTGQRIERLLGLGSAAFPRVIPAGTDTIVGATDIAQQAVGQSVVNVAESSQDMLMIDAAGYIFDLPRRAGYNLPVSWVFGEQPGEYSYLASITTDHDPTQVYNDVTLTQLATPAVAGGQAVGAAVAVANQASIARYGDRTDQKTSYLTDAALIADQGWWIVNTMGDPSNRIAQMTLDPSAYPALWPVVLGIETGQVVYVNRRLGGTDPQIAGYMQVMNISHTIAQRSWQTTLILVPYPGNVLTCDDVLRGVLDGQNDAIGW